MMFYNIKLKNILFIVLSFFVMLMASSCAGNANEPLDTPENLRVEKITEDSVIIKWDSVENTDGYEVEIKNISTGEGDWIIHPDGTSAEFNNLDWDETYQVSVKACAKGTVWDRYSDSQSATITFKTKIPVVSAGQLARPENLKAVYENGTLILSWDQVENAMFYEIHSIYYGWIKGDYLDYLEKTQWVDGSEFSLEDKYITEYTSKVLYTVCARDSELSSKSKNCSKKLYVKIKE